jgi:hypothetical protein
MIFSSCKKIRDWCCCFKQKDLPPANDYEAMNDPDVTVTLFNTSPSSNNSTDKNKQYSLSNDDLSVTYNQIYK